MKSAFIHEFRRQLPAMLLLTVIVSAVCCISAATSKLISGADLPCNSQITASVGSISGLCALAPILQLSYRMNKRGADLWLSLPIRREKFLLVRMLEGLLLVVVPFTVSYWLSFLIVVLRDNAFWLPAYPLFYLSALPPALGLLAYNSFFYSRANNAADGIVFMALWNVFPTLVYLFVLQFSPQMNLPGLLEGMYFMPEYLLSYTSIFFDNMACGEANTNFFSLQSSWQAIVFFVAASLATGAALFATARRARAEDADQLSETMFGYKLLLPAILAILICFAGGSVSVTIVFAVLGLAATVFSRRTFRLRPRDYGILAGAVVLGLVFAAVAINLREGGEAASAAQMLSVVSPFVA